jgi:hypothetical protein
LACIQPLITSVLCADTAEVGVAEWIRAALLLGEMIAVDPVSVLGAMNRLDADGATLFFSLNSAPNSAFTTVLHKVPSQWKMDDAITFSACISLFPFHFNCGCTAFLEDIETKEVQWVTQMLAAPYFSHNADPPERFVPGMLTPRGQPLVQPYNHHTTTMQSTKDWPPSSITLVSRDSNSGGAGGPPDPLGLASA